MSRSSRPRSASRAFSSGTQVVGPQSNSAGPSDGLEQVGADHPLPPEVPQVERRQEGHPCQRSGSSHALTRLRSRVRNGCPV